MSSAATAAGAALVHTPARARNIDKPAVAAGFTYVGQFLDHDMTFDPTSSLARRQDPESIRNFRIPPSTSTASTAGGPDVSPHLYDITVDRGRTTFLLEEIPGSLGAARAGWPASTCPATARWWRSPAIPATTRT